MADSESSETSRAELFPKIANGKKLLLIFVENAILDVSVTSECISGCEKCE